MHAKEYATTPNNLSILAKLVAGDENGDKPVEILGTIKI